jgi:DNA-binding FadR family transcriptional regulator
LRGIIEPAAASLAAQRRTSPQIEAMRHSLEAMGRYGLATEEGRTADQQFHRSILEATHNEALASLASSVGAAVDWTTRYKQRHHELPRNPLPEHLAVFIAIKASDGDLAHQAMAELLRLAFDDTAATLS